MLLTDASGSFRERVDDGANFKTETGSVLTYLYTAFPKWGHLYFQLAWNHLQRMSKLTLLQTYFHPIKDRKVTVMKFAHEKVYVSSSKY